MTKQTLRDISNEYLELSSMLDDGDDEAVRNTLELVEHNLETKVDNICNLMSEWQAAESTIADEIKRLQTRKKVYEHRRDRLKNYLKWNLERLNQPKIETSLHTVSLRKGSESVVVDNINELPDEFTHVEVRANKTLIKGAIKNGHDIPGAHLERGPNSVVIK